MLVDDDDLLLRTLGRCLSLASGLRVVEAHDEDEVCALLDDDARPSIALIDVNIDGDTNAGFRVAELVRFRCGLLPIALMTGHDDPELPNRAMDARFAFFRKLGQHDHLRTWVRDQARSLAIAPAELARATADIARELRLSPRQTDLLRAAVEHSGGIKELAQILGIELSTAATHAKRILAASGERTLQSVVTRVHERARHYATLEASAARAEACALADRNRELEAKLTHAESEGRTGVDASSPGFEQNGPTTRPKGGDDT